jgi:hypothetical protein
MIYNEMFSDGQAHSSIWATNKLDMGTLPSLELSHKSATFSIRDISTIFHVPKLGPQEKKGLTKGRVFL